MYLVLRQLWYYLSGSAVFLVLELKYNGDLDVIFRKEQVRGSKPHD